MGEGVRGAMAPHFYGTMFARKDQDTLIEQSQSILDTLLEQSQYSEKQLVTYV